MRSVLGDNVPFSSFHYVRMSCVKLAFMIAVLLLHYCIARGKKRRFDETDISNDVLVEEFERLPGYSGFRRIDYIIESNVIPEYRVLAPSEVKSEISRRLKNDGYDPYFLKDLPLRIPSESLDGERVVDVVLDHGVIVGMSDFHSIDSKMSANSKDLFQLLLVWNRLRVNYRVTVDHGGLKTVGEVGSDVGRLLMDVQVRKTNAKFPRIEMSKVTEVKTELTDLETLLDDFKTTVCLEIEIQIKNILNNEIRNILLKYAKDVLTNSSSEENMLSSYYSTFK